MATKKSIVKKAVSEDIVVIGKATDLGNYNCKTDLENIFLGTFEEVTEVNAIDVKVLEFNGKKYAMETQTTFEDTFNKSQKNYLPNLLWSYHKDGIPQKCKIRQCLGVPIENLGVLNNFIEELEGNTFEFIAEGKEYSIEFEKVAITGEGFSSFYTLSQVEMLNDLIIFDIGGRTINVAIFKNKRCVERIQINKGMIDVYDEIKTLYNSLGNNVNTEEVKEYIQKGLIDDEIVKQAHIKILRYALRIVKRKINIDLYKCWFTGGGSVEMKTTIEEIFNNPNFMAKPLFSNVLGNKKIIDIKWSDLNE